MLTVSDNHIVLGGGGGGGSGGYALYNRASSAPSSTATDGIVLLVGQSITNSYDTPQNSYVRAMGYEITVSVITE